MNTKIIKHEVYRERPYATGPNGEDWSQWINESHLSIPYSGGDLTVVSVELIIEQEEEETNQPVLPCINLQKRIYGYITIIPSLCSGDDYLSDIVKRHDRFLKKCEPFDITYRNHADHKMEKIFGICITESCGFGIYKFVARTWVDLSRKVQL